MVLTQLCKRCVRLRLERDWEDTADLILAYSGCPLIDECQDNKQKHRKKRKKKEYTVYEDHWHSSPRFAYRLSSRGLKVLKRGEVGVGGGPLMRSEPNSYTCTHILQPNYFIPRIAVRVCV